MTQKEFAKYLEISETHLKKLLGGSRSWRKSNAIAKIVAIDTDVATIYNLGATDDTLNSLIKKHLKGGMYDRTN